MAFNGDPYYVKDGEYRVMGQPEHRMFRIDGIVPGGDKYHMDGGHGLFVDAYPSQLQLLSHAVDLEQWQRRQQYK